MDDLASRVRPFFVKLTDREPAEVDMPAAARRERVGSKGLLYARLDQPAMPKGRRRSTPSSDAGIMVLLYGPDDRRASKLVVSATGKKAAMRRWMAVDVLEDPTVLVEARAFIASLGIPELTMTAGTVGCPHEEGHDFAEGAECGTCPAWKGRQGSAAEEDPYAKAERLAEALERGEIAPPTAGRNDPCPCGSGKKFKKCCGA